MQYRDFIKMDRQFESAVNLGLDLNKHKKLEEYIPTDSSVNLLKEYLINIQDDSSEKASVLIGPYGKGKTHLVLVLCALVGMSSESEANRQALEKLINNISKQDKEAAEIAQRLIENKKRLLPVIINGGYSDLQQTFLLALKEALDRENINNITPNTYYDVAIQTIRQWEEKYPETLRIFENKLNDKKYTLKQLINELSCYDKKAYNLFCKIHPLVCSGSIFNPMIKMDIVNMYKIVNEELCKQYGYSGILVIFDEFSKFLDNTKVHASGELKILQDFAEFTNRKGNQVHLLCITHKPIGNYSKDLPKERALAYRTVEGRFKEIYFVSSAEQNYGLIRNSIQKDESLFTKYVDENKSYFEELKDQTTSIGIFPQGINVLDEIVEGCFPLHPMTTFMAIRISELVAQNERTLFTFLTSHQKYTLRNFIETTKSKNKTLTMDRLYDYFKDGIKKELSNETIAAVYTQTENLLKHKLSKVQVKILKSMALINMINQPSLVQTTAQVLKVAINEADQVFEQEMNELMRSHYIFKRKSDGVFICLNASTVDIRNRINECRQLKVRNINRKEILEKVVDLGYALPKSFNDKFEMIRFFKNQIITYDELMIMDEIDEALLKQNCDGIIGYLIYKEGESLELIKQKVDELADKRLLIYIPNEPFAIDEYLKEYVAIDLLKNDKHLVENDEPVLEELDIYMQDTVEAITNYINTYFALENEQHCWVAKEEKIEQVKNTIQLSRVLSSICEEVYSCTPIIASELINKHNISGPIVTARNKVISNILEGNKTITEGNSPDVTITRAVITNKFILEGTVTDTGLQEVLNAIDTFIHAGEGHLQNLGDLYNKLYRAPYGVRKGVIAIYLVIYLKKYSNEIVIYNQLKEIELNLETIKLIDKDPSNYKILLEKGSRERLDYINDLAIVFGVDIAGMSFHQQCKAIVEKMKNWFRSLPKCSRELQGEAVEGTCILEFRKQIIKFDINPREFLLELIPDVICKNTSLESCINQLKEVKEICESYFTHLIESLIQQTKDIFVPQYVGELGGALKTWYLSLETNVEQYMLSAQTNKLLEIIPNLQDYNERNILGKLGYDLTGLQIEDWVQDTVEIFIEELHRILADINSFKNQKHKEERDLQVTIKVDGKERSKVLRSGGISTLGETLLTNLSDAMDEYGDAIDSTEKMNILVKLLEKIM